jgi:hypothetical protein
MAELEEGDEQSVIVSPARSNEQVVSAIRDYCRFKHAQGFAIMVDGKWGSGKTHLIKSIMGDLIVPESTGPSSKPLYISLYGVKSVDEIADLIYQRLHPVLSSKPIRIGGVILKAFAKGALKIDVDAMHRDSLTLTPSLSDLGALDLMSGTPRSVIIFDDFERAAMPASELLGYINPFVEHDNCKVIIVANESEILDQKDYKLRKEKTVGRTYEILPDVESAFEDFNRTIDDKAVHEFFRRQKTSLLTIFGDSESGNLRSLKQSLWEFERVWQTLTKDQRSNEKAMHELLGIMCAITFEIRSSRITGEAIRRQESGHFMCASLNEVDPDTAANQTMYKRYPSVDWASTLLSAGTVCTIVDKGRIDAADIQRQFRLHPYFTAPEDVPSWVALWRSYALTESTQKEVLKRFAGDFEARTFRSYGHVLHVIGLCLWLADIGQDGWPADTVMDLLRAYIGDVYVDAVPTIDDVKPKTGIYDLMRGADGFAFKMADDQRFQKLASELREQDQAWRRRALPEVAKRLMDLMTTDGETFLREICHTNGGSSRYASLPVLHTIPAERFADIFINEKFENQKNIMIGLSIRYEQAYPGQDLNVEIPWAQAILKEIRSQYMLLSPISRDYVSGTVDHYLGQAVSNILSVLPSPETSP